MQARDLRLGSGNGRHIGTYSAGLELDPDLRLAVDRDVDAESGWHARPDDERRRQHSAQSLLPPCQERCGRVACVDAECRQDGDEGCPRYEAVSALPVPELGRDTQFPAEARELRLGCRTRRRVGGSGFLGQRHGPSLPDVRPQTRPAQRGSLRISTSRADACRPRGRPLPAARRARAALPHRRAYRPASRRSAAAAIRRRSRSIRSAG